MAEKSSLSAKQLEVIALLAGGATIVSASKTAGVGERTIHTWNKQPAFQDALEQAQRQLYEQHLKVLRTGVSTSLKVLLGLIVSEKVPEAVRARCAIEWVKLSLEVNKGLEVEKRLNTLEDLLRDVG